MNLTPTEALQFVDAIAADRATLARIRAALGDDDGDIVEAVTDLLDDVRRGGVCVPDSVLESVWIDVRRLAGPPCMSEGLDGAIRRAVDALAAACPGDGPIVPRVVELLRMARETADMVTEHFDERNAIVLAIVAAQAPEAATLAERVKALAGERDKARAELAAATEEVARLRAEVGNARERAYAAERERDNVRAKASAELAAATEDAAHLPVDAARERAGAATSTPRTSDRFARRFVVVLSVGFVSIEDTAHPERVGTIAQSRLYPWIVCYWDGEQRDGEWIVSSAYVAEAERVCALLNDLDAKSRP